MLSAFELSAGVFERGLKNLKAQLAKAEAHAAGSEAAETAMLGSRLAIDGGGGNPASGSYDLHRYTLAAQVYWSAEGARLAVARLLEQPASPTTPPETQGFRELNAKIDSTIAFLRGIAVQDLEAGLEREIVLETRHGVNRSSGSRFLTAYAIPHFYYHVISAYTILRNQGVHLTMGDFLGGWAES